MSENNQLKRSKNWISDRTIAQRFEISRSTVWAWARSGKLPPPVKLGENVTRWDEEEVDRLIDESLRSISYE